MTSSLGLSETAKLHNTLHNRYIKPMLRGLRAAARPASEGLKNATGIALIPESMRARVFGPRKRQDIPEHTEVALEHLREQHLIGRETTAPKKAPNIHLPRLLGLDLDQHFYKIGLHMSEPYLSICQQFVCNTDEDSKVPTIPAEFRIQSGWLRYGRDGSIDAVDFPKDEIIVFDVETMYRLHPFAIIATAVSTDAWYVWLSPWLLGEDNNPRHLVPLGDHRQVIIGHNVSYDRKRVKEEYNLKSTKKFFLDTMSLHIATAGMCSRQRPQFQKYKKLRREQKNAADEAVDGDEASETEEIDLTENPWLKAGTLNGVKDVFEFNYPKSKLVVAKDTRDKFETLDKNDLLAVLPDLIKYCATDVLSTKMIFNKVFPNFLRVCPHPVSFGALGKMGSLFLPVTKAWNSYLRNSEEMYDQIKEETAGKLHRLAEETSLLINDENAMEKISNDPWLRQLDWAVAPVKMTKGTRKSPPRPVKKQKLPGKPEWFRDLFPSAKKPMNLTLRSRVAPILLRLKWDDNPLHWKDEQGWCFETDTINEEKYRGLKYAYAGRQGRTVFFKLPHKDGYKARCGNPMAKGYLSYFEKNILTSADKEAYSIVQKNTQCAYWIAIRERVRTQMPLWQEEIDMGFEDKEGGMILPSTLTMGTVTRRAVENTWLTASNAKANRIGSEIKAMVTAPKGYVFVGADVDSEELWIASVIGDSLFGIHGGTGLGWRTLEGSKNDGTDLHSQTAGILNTSRNDAKVFNYSRIYGAGSKFTAQLLKQSNPNMSDELAKKKAEDLYLETKGEKVRLGKTNEYWMGGSESVVFNQLELMARQAQQRTPVLGAGITSALLFKNLNSKNNYLTSRINWSIQSSGVDYLHLLIASMYYLCKLYNIDARLVLTVHDEIRYMVRDEDKYRAGLALQIANLWTRSMFCQQLGMDDLPQSVAFFSLVDFDHVLRKEVDLECVTPSHPDPIPPGFALDIDELTEKCQGLGNVDEKVQSEFEAMPYKYREPLLPKMRAESISTAYLRSQTVKDPKLSRKLARSTEHIAEYYPLILSSASVKGLF